MPHTIPPLILESLELYDQHGIEPGSCVAAILSNDLSGTLCSADADTLATLPAIVGYIRHEMPSICHGSRERVDAWLAHQGRKGL